MWGNAEMQLPISIHTTYQDLLETHRLKSIAAFQGKPYIKEMSNGRYWYTRQRIGQKIVDRYVGPDTKQVREQIAKAAKTAEDMKQIDRRCGILVAQLRSAGLPTVDRQTGSILNAMGKTGVFRLGGTLVGTHAFRLYSAELGHALSGALAVTQDIDVAAFENLKLAIHDQVDPSIADTFKNLSLEPAPNLDPKGRPTRWSMRGGGAMVDFLAPRMQGKRNIVKLEPLNVYAQTLPFLNYLIADPIQAVVLYRSGVLVQIPKPERYAVHKLIVAQRRSGSGLSKVSKDLAQAEMLIQILAEDRPAELANAYLDAMQRGLKWRSAISASLDRRPEIAEVIKRVT